MKSVGWDGILFLVWGSRRKTPFGTETTAGSCYPPTNYWVVVKELKLSYYNGEALLFTIYTHYGNLI